MFNGPTAQVVSLSSMEYKAIVDACGRACKAAKNAQRLSSAAAGAFAEEAAVLEDVQNYMKAKIDQANKQADRT